ncbi:MAG: aminotransferase class V-fold PLP-dependent enzyme, partial [Pseudomonadota bacterium]
MLHYGRHHITEDDIREVANILRDDIITTGPVAEKFEKAFAEYIGAKHAVVVCNATAALHLALLVAGVGQGDRVVTSPNTFLASANCAAFTGATPDFADIDADTYNLCPQALEDNWQADTRAVIPVHYAGGPADMAAIAKVARERGAVVIEDACHAVGGSIKEDSTLRKIGGHRYADITTFSFHPVKTMTSGEGGMLVTDNDHYAATARLLRTHGMVRQIDNMQGLGMSAYDERGPWYYEMQALGYNMRVTDFQCALGISQLSRLDKMIARRREIVQQYNTAFADVPLIKTPALTDASLRNHTSWHLYSIQC